MDNLCDSFKDSSAFKCEEIIFENDANFHNSFNLDNSNTHSTIIDSKRRSFSNLKHENICENVDGDVILENLIGMNVKLLGEINSLRVINVIDSQLNLDGICKGSIFIDKVKGGKFSIAGDQVRIHDTSDVDIFFYSKNGCILENCENLRIYPNRKAAKISNQFDNEDYWKCVHDFGFNSENSFKFIDLSDE